MELNVPYFNLSKRETEATFGVLVEILLKSRVRMHLETTREGYDEDVNAYLAGVLLEYIDPAYHASTRHYLADHDLDVFLEATREDSYHTYWVYKINADDRLVDLGIFQRQRDRQPAVLAQTSAYYEFAAGYNHRLYGRATAISDIMDKLARGTERYVSILQQARRDYLHFVSTLTDDELQALSRDLDQESHTLPLKAKQDDFLDAYSAWQRTSDPAIRAKLLQLLDELRRIDPRFPGPDFARRIDPTK